jgi:hypothetical protein
VTALFTILARPRTLAVFGSATLALAALVFGLAIPEVEVRCGVGPPDVRLYTTATELHAFLDGCGPAGRAAYTRLQLVDLVYPVVRGGFFTGMLAWVARRVSPGGRLDRLPWLTLASAVADYVENAASWLALLRYPEPGPLDGLLGPVSALKQSLGDLRARVHCAARGAPREAMATRVTAPPPPTTAP